MKVMVSRMNFAMVDGRFAHAMRRVCHFSTSMVQKTTSVTITGKNHLESMMRCAKCQ